MEDGFTKINHLSRFNLIIGNMFDQYFRFVLYGVMIWVHFYDDDVGCFFFLD